MSFPELKVFDSETSSGLIEELISKISSRKRRNIYLISFLKEKIYFLKYPLKLYKEGGFGGKLISGFFSFGDLRIFIKAPPEIFNFLKWLKREHKNLDFSLSIRSWNPNFKIKKRENYPDNIYFHSLYVDEESFYSYVYFKEGIRVLSKSRLLIIKNWVKKYGLGFFMDWNNNYSFYKKAGGLGITIKDHLIENLLKEDLEKMEKRLNYLFARYLLERVFFNSSDKNLWDIFLSLKGGEDGREK